MAVALGRAGQQGPRGQQGAKFPEGAQLKRQQPGARRRNVVQGRLAWRLICAGLIALRLVSLGPLG